LLEKIPSTHNDKRSKKKKMKRLIFWRLAGSITLCLFSTSLGIADDWGAANWDGQEGSPHEFDECPRGRGFEHNDFDRGCNGPSGRLMSYSDDAPGPWEPENYSHPILEVYGPSAMAR
jgi:hypothetical protein